MSSSSSFGSPLTVFPPVAVPTQSTFGGGGGGGNNGGGGGGSSANSSNTSLANSASLYRTFHYILSFSDVSNPRGSVYTFLATLVLLLAVSGAIVVRSFILRRRHRRMVEEAIRNGTWIPPTPAVRPARVDLSKKPELWEAYLGDNGWQLGSFGHGSGKELDKNWKFEYSRDWESIKPICASYYVAPLTSVPYSGSTPNLTSLPPPVSIPTSTPTNPSAPRGDGDDNQRTPEVSTGTTPSLLTRARIFLNSTSASSSADNGTNAHSNSANISLTELSSNSPASVRVAVLIAMPSPSYHGSSTSTTPLSASFPSSLSSKVEPTASHPLQLSPSRVRVTDDEEHTLPHLEMGVAEVVVGGRSDNSPTWDSAHTRKTTTYSRGSSYAEP